MCLDFFSKLFVCLLAYLFNGMDGWILLCVPRWYGGFELVGRRESIWIVKWMVV